MGTTSQTNPVKSIPIRKAYREGQSADVVADALFRLAIDSRLHFRREGRYESVRQLLKTHRIGVEIYRLGYLSLLRAKGTAIHILSRSFPR